MKITGTSTLVAPPHQVWDAVHDPAVLARCLPGCERLTEHCDEGDGSGSRAHEADFALPNRPQVHCRLVAPDTGSRGDCSER